MVISHAILIPLQEVITWSDLRPLFGLLIDSPEQPAVLATVDISPTGAEPSFTPELITLAQALVVRGTGPVVRVGIEEFEGLITGLWSNCWPAIRARLAFRLSFGPHDIVESPAPVIVCSPMMLAARWGGHRIAGAESTSVVTRAAAMLSGSPEAIPIMGYAQEIGAEITQFTDLPMLERAFEVGTALSPTFGQLLAAIRLVERLSPEPSVGVAAKEVLIEEFLKQLSNASVTDVLLLRNLTADGFASAYRIWPALESWAARKKFELHEDAQMLSVISGALSISDAIERWRRAIIAGISTASNTAFSEFPAAFWRWVIANAEVLQGLAKHLPVEGALESLLVQAAPLKMPEDVGDVVMGIAKAKHWFALHGVAAGASLAARAAVDRQLSVDLSLAYFDGIRAALRSVPPAQLVDIALSIEEPRLLRIAAEQVADNPKLLSDANVANSRVQELWLEALQLKPAVWNGPREPQKAFFSILQNLLDGHAANRQLIIILSKTPLANLSEYPRMAEVWGRVQEPALEHLLSATSTGWLKNAAKGDILTPDSRLQTAILASSDLDLTLERLVSPGVSIRIMTTLAHFAESRLLRWLDVWPQGRELLSTSDAEALGQMIMRRYSQRAAEKLAQLMFSGRNDVRPALRICSEKLGVVARWRLKLSSHSEQDNWECLEELAAELYPKGPDHDELWSRAGGLDADLQHGGSGRSRWRNAIAQIRRGKEPRVSILLKEMRIDYPGNGLLRDIVNDADFGGAN
jgi:hypothetical protein